MQYDEVILPPDSLAANVSASNFRGVSLVILFVVIILIIILMVIAIRTSKHQYMIDVDHVPSSVPRTIRAGLAKIKSRYANPGESHTDDGKVYYPDNGSHIINSAECNQKPYRRWYNGKCLCMAPFYGESCERESHSTDYYPVGNYPFQGQPFPVDRKAFPFQGINAEGQKICEKECHSQENCTGYQYENNNIEDGIETNTPSGLCYLLTEQLNGSGDGYSELIDSNTYLVKGKRPFFPNQVFLYKGTLKNRFWNDSNVHNPSYNYVKLGIGLVNRIEWTAKGIINDGKHTIVVSNNYFTPDEGEKISKLPLTPNGWYISYDGDEYSPPYYITATGDPYWIMALENKPIFSERSVSRPSKECYF